MGVQAILLAAAMVAQNGCPAGAAAIPIPAVTSNPDPRSEEPVPTYGGPAHGSSYASAIAAVQAGDSALEANERLRADRDFRRASAAFARVAPSPKALDRHLLGTVLHLAYYFAATGDRQRAITLWRVFMAGATPAWAQPANPTIGILLQHKHFRQAFLAMQHDDRGLIYMWFDPVVRDTKFIQAVDSGIGGDFVSAARLFLTEAHCGREEYGYYGAGVAEYAMQNKRAALNAWLAASLTNDHPLPDQPAFGETTTRAVALLLRFF